VIDDTRETARRRAIARMRSEKWDLLMLPRTHAASPELSWYALGSARYESH